MKGRTLGAIALAIFLPGGLCVLTGVGVYKAGAWVYRKAVKGYWGR